MNLSSMRYKTFVWPHNPEIYEIDFTRDIACHKVPFGAYILQNMGRTCRILRGSGEFVGENAYDDFKELANLFYDNTAGLLIHPLWQECYAYFAKLTLRQEPRADYVAYTFEFWERFEQYGQSTEAGYDSYGEPSTNYHVVKYGETFWSIAELYGGADYLRELNPSIKNTSAISVGDIIKIR